MAQWLWRLQSDTLGSSPAVAVFFSSPDPFSLHEQVSSNETSTRIILPIIMDIKNYV